MHSKCSKVRLKSSLPKIQVFIGYGDDGRLIAIHSLKSDSATHDVTIDAVLYMFIIVFELPH